jgi:hypothetical protein
MINAKVKLFFIGMASLLLILNGCQKCTKCVCRNPAGCPYYDDTLSPMYWRDSLPYKYTECVDVKSPSIHYGFAVTRINELKLGFRMDCSSTCKCP